MLTKEQQDLLTQTDPGTPGGELLRRYWQQIALAAELPQDGAPVPVRIMSEDLVVFGARSRSTRVTPSSAPP